jgi:hypothetical protein
LRIASTHDDARDTRPAPDFGGVRVSAKKFFWQAREAAMGVWQVAAGSAGRDYTGRFLRHGMAFVGGDIQCSTMDQYVQLGDEVILKRGLSEIVAVGRVVARDGKFKGVADKHGDKQWLWDFDGWELPAWCYVDWHIPSQPKSTNGLTRATIQRVNLPHLLALTEEVLKSNPVKTTYDAEPANTKEVNDETLITDLVQLGLRPGAAEEFAQALRRIRRLVRFYLDREWSLTNEHDARTFLVVPLLIALGWAEQKMKIELQARGVGRVDIGCFNKPFNGHDDQCIALIETKALTQGLDYATNQAHKYASSFPSCNVVLATNGYCYKAYERTGDTFSTVPNAYLNINFPRNRYPLDPEQVGGAIEVLKLLLPIG